MTTPRVALGRDSVVRGGGALLACAAATGVVLLLPASLWVPSGVLVYLVAVLGVASLAGRWPAILASFVSFATFDFLFTEPRFTFAVEDPNEWVALVAFLVVALAASQLAAGQRERVLDAEAREHEARTLHDLSDLLAGSSFHDSLTAAAERLRLELGADAVAIVIDADGARARAEAGNEAATGALRGLIGPISILGGGKPASATSPGSPGIWVRVRPPAPPGRRGHPRNVGQVAIRQDEEALGQLLVKWPESERIGTRQARLLDTAADQLAHAVDRERLRARATESEVLRRTSELKSALLDAVSHDLRTPLASIIASAGSMRQTDVEWTPEELRDFAGTIEQEAGRLNRIVGNLLDLSRIQGGTLVPARDWHDPVMLVSESLERLHPLVAEHRLVTDLPDDLPPVLIDPVEVDQVITNLVENAVKYSAPGSEIGVGARVTDGELRVIVEDRGPGLPKEALSRLFEPFYRGPAAQAVRGSGLGLAVARGLVYAHNGRMWAENREDGGARFGFAIPTPTPDPELAEPRR